MATILIVEDDPLMNRFLCRAAEEAGHRVISTANGREAVAAVGDTDLDLIVLDLVMPEMDGLETLNLIREARGAFKILAISGGGRVGAEDYLRVARILGADRTMAKPFSAPDFIREVSELLAGPA